MSPLPPVAPASPLTSHAETDMDYAVRLISLEDDPTLPIWTFRMWFLSLGLSCFAAILSQIFVSLSPGTYNVYN